MDSWTFIFQVAKFGNVLLWGMPPFQEWAWVYSCVDICGWGVFCGSSEISLVGILTTFTVVWSKPSVHLLMWRSVDLDSRHGSHALLDFPICWRPFEVTQSLCLPLLQVTSQVLCGCRLRRSGPLPVRGSLLCPYSCRVGRWAVEHQASDWSWHVQGASLLPCRIWWYQCRLGVFWILFPLRGPPHSWTPGLFNLEYSLLL